MADNMHEGVYNTHALQGKRTRGYDSDSEGEQGPTVIRTPRRTVGFFLKLSDMYNILIITETKQEEGA